MSRRRPVDVSASSSRTTKPSRAPRRRLRRATKVVVVLGIAAVVVAFASQWVLHRSYFRVQNVTVLGVRHEPQGKVLVATGLESHPAMIDVSAQSIEQRLTAFTWISSVSVAKHWPSTVVVTVHEGRAIAVAFNHQHVLQYVDAVGRDLGTAPLHVNLPTLLYADATKVTWPFLNVGRSAAIVASQLPRAFGPQVSTIAEDSRGSVTLKMTTPVSFVLGPPTDLEAKFVAVASVIAHSAIQPGSVVNVTVPGELAVVPPSLK